MFTKEILMDLLKKNEGRNFRIFTNIAQGRGINGVEFMSFIGMNYNGERRDLKRVTSSVKGFADTYLVIECAKSAEYGFYYGGAKREVYVPYASIVMVDFIADESHPLYEFTGRHILEEI